LKLLQERLKEKGMPTVTEETYPVADETIEVIAEEASLNLDSGPSFDSFSDQK
jgi:hypothetical protein